ncbi:Eukaryotic translation initiation factor isoform 4G-1 [Apostasia shenzhenica]|uniref:Eukaryotic translation initiation factor isoform 4G-1 n=1 Tax=Apostasia shenzhenica TaxID=1088818 RepID=A0A2I0BE89_9ASPA|nr:Eukaryotic translation initiation factor isoform 4G-1 [Apostasia shenzhenica]
MRFLTPPSSLTCSRTEPPAINRSILSFLHFSPDSAEGKSETRTKVKARKRKDGGGDGDRSLLGFLSFPVWISYAVLARFALGWLTRAMASPREGFLTDEQREMMKMVSQNADLLSSSPRSSTGLSSLLPEHHNNKGGRAAAGGNAVRHVRRSHSGKLVRVKKDGAGGKGTWGKLLDTGSDVHLDRNDPNYDSGEEPYQLVGATVSSPLDDYKKAVSTIIEEYFTTGDVQLAVSDIRDIGLDEYHHYFIKKLISMAMDRHDKEKEMASVLLSALYAVVISSAQISQGFIMLLESTEDLAVDILNAVDVLALFISRAVVDDIIPPAFLNKAKKVLPENSKGLEVLATAEKSYLSAPHHAELIERKWGGSTHLIVEEVKKKISDLLREYIESGDTAEACQCIRELGVSFFHHEVVKRALTLAMETQSQLLIFRLLKVAAEEGLISSSQMVKGFSRLADSLDDLTLDIPSAKAIFHQLVPVAISEGWLDSSFVKSSGADGKFRNVEEEKIKKFKEEAVTIIHEYFLSDDIPELVRSLEDLSAPQYNPIFIKKLITLAMDRKNREKEMASVLLSALGIDFLSTDDIVNGFIMLLESAEDTALDILDASNELALFLARAVIDDVLAPLNLQEISSKLPPNCSGSETVHMARSLISARHAGERLLRCWGGGTGWAVEDAKDKITKLLEEFESGGDVGEACRCIRDLGMPFFNHEVVKKALVMAMEKKNDRILDLLQESFGEGLITINQMTKGFSRVKDGLDDLALDIPNAREKFGSYIKHAENNNWLLKSFVLSAQSA